MNAEDRRHRVIAGLFYDCILVEDTFAEFLNSGFRKEDITVMMSEETRDRCYGILEPAGREGGTMALEGARVGATVSGGAVGIVAAIAATAAPVAFPGIGIVLTGPLAAALAGTGAGVLGGGLVGALIGQGIEKHSAENYGEAITGGGIVLAVTVRGPEDAARARDIFDRQSGEYISQ